jgi:ligand-binding sensor domain-containing protein
MWFGTKDGLNLYNGYSNTVFRNIPGDSSSLGNNFIRSLYEDTDTKDIWVGTDDGLFIFQPATMNFRPFAVTTEDGIRISGPVNDIEPGKDGALWIAAYGKGVFKYDPATGSLKQYTSPDDIITNHIWTVATDTYGNIWASTFKSGYCRYNKNGMLSTFSLSVKPIVFPILMIRNVFWRIRKTIACGLVRLNTGWCGMIIKRGKCSGISIRPREHSFRG